MRKLYYDKWFDDDYVPAYPDLFPAYGDDSDRYMYCQCLIRTYRNEGKLSSKFVKLKEFISDKFGIDIIGIRIEGQTIRFGTLSDWNRKPDRRDPEIDPELCNKLIRIMGIDVDSFYIENDTENINWKHFIDTGIEIQNSYSSAPGISEIRMSSLPSRKLKKQAWQISVVYELDEDLLSGQTDGRDLKLAKEVFDNYSSKSISDSDDDRIKILFTSYETSCEKIMKPVTKSEPLFPDKMIFSPYTAIDRISVFSDARGYLFLEIHSTDNALTPISYYKYPPKTSITPENYKEIFAKDYGHYPQYSIYKDGSELKTELLYGKEEPFGSIKEIEFFDKGSYLQVGPLVPPQERMPGMPIYKLIPLD